MAVTKTYEFETVDASGKRDKGRVDAATETAAAALLRQRGFVDDQQAVTT